MPAKLVVEIKVDDRGFRPDRAVVAFGGRIRFRVVGSLNHIISGPSMLSPLLRPQQEWEYVVGEPGVFQYGCEVISYMRGEVEVVQLEGDGSEAEALPGSDTEASFAADGGGEAEAEAEANVSDPEVDGETSTAAPLRWSGLSVENVLSQYRGLKAALGGHTGGDVRSFALASSAAGDVSSESSDEDSDDHDASGRAANVHSDRVLHKLDAERRVLNSRAGEHRRHLVGCRAQIVPDQTRPDQTRPHQTTPHQTTPHQTTPHQIKPALTSPSPTSPSLTSPIPNHP